MPTCGKTTLGKMISEKHGYEFIDIDELIEKKVNCKIVDYINKLGEENFRKVESEIIKEVSSNNHLVISTGGGAILREENIDKRDMLVDRVLELISEVESCTKRLNGKNDACRAMTVMHNLPKALHGIDTLGSLPAISPGEAMKYSGI